MHDRSIQSGQQRRGPVGVDGIVVTGDHRERPHINRGGNGDVAAASARGVGGVFRHRSPSPHRIGELGRTGAAANREPLLEHRQNRPGRIADVHRDRHHTTDLGVDGDRRCCGDD